jgi:hypothetical protein
VTSMVGSDKTFKSTSILGVPSTLIYRTPPLGCMAD